MLPWLFKQLQPPPNTRPIIISGTPKLFTYLRCAICAAVALCGPPICDPTVKTSSSDIAPSFVSCWSAARFAIFALAGCSRKAEKAFRLILFQPRESSLSRCLVLNAFSSATGKAKRVARSMSVREKPHPGRGAWSSRILRCSSCIQHCQNFASIIVYY